MIDETSGIIGWPIGQQYRDMAARNEASTTTVETLVEQYRERAKLDDARIAELAQRANHWHDTAQMLKRQRNTAEEERDSWKLRAMQSEQGRQVNRDLLIIAEGQRDQAKADAEHWKGEWAVVMGQLGGARAEVEAVTQRAEAAEAKYGVANECHEYALRLYKETKAECEALRQDAERLDAIESGEVHIECMGMTLRHMNVYSKHGKCVTSGLFGTQLSLTLRQAIDAAMAVQPTTGEAK